MSLIWVPLLSLLGSIVSAFTAKMNRSQSALVCALFPAIALAIVIYHGVSVLDGEIIRYSLSWIPILGINIAFRLDGLALLFCLMI